ncbi:hypothetical protein AWC38_SpisGene6134 [Stylophora pistillata]|uniref:Uncharacterized protein n=1 Tax=Stylophora pistillata TaxID=50429 RepID=A0A2B4SJ16_STYPI|nr:hypothetical protein AWC38_SpisGene6134 [Stylophora pistillata]
MASWLLPGKKSNQNHDVLPPLQQKSRIPVKIAHLSRESDGSLDKKVRLHKDSDKKLQNKLSSRIPIVVDKRETKVNTKDNLPKNVKTTRGEKAFGRDSGINLKETQGKKDKRKASAIPSTTAKYGSYWPAKETTSNIRGRVPRQLALLETEAKLVCSDEKEPREESSASEVSPAARTEDVTPDFKFNVTPVHEEELCMGAEANFSGNDFGDNFERHSKSSDEKTMPNAPPWLREEYREREELNDDINIVKDDTAVPSAAKDFRLEPEFDTEDKLDKNGLSEEELDCSSFTESSGYKRKMAELDEKSRRLKAQFAEENRQAIESMNKIVEEIKQSQAREDTITNEIEEMRRRQDDIKGDLKRLDEMGQRRELEDKKWREKMDRKKMKVARRLAKIRAERRKYQEETTDESGSKEEHDQPDENLNENPVDEKCKHFTMENETVVSEDIDNKVLYEPHEIKEYKSVKELEKKRKELRRLERLEKKAIKREKLEQSGRKKIEKQKRKVARKLEKLSAKSSNISDGNSEDFKCINQPMETSNTTTKETFDETPSVSTTKPCAAKTLDGTESKQVQMAHSPGLLTYGAEFEKFEEKFTKVENKEHIPSDSGAPTKVGLEEESYNNAAIKNQKASNYSDEQRKRVDDNTDAQILCSGKEDTLNDISVEQLSLEEALSLDQEGSDKIQVELESKGFLSDDSAPVSSRTGCQEPFKEDKEKLHLGEPVAMSHVRYFPSPDCSGNDEYCIEDEPVDKDVSVSNSEESNGYGDYKLDLFSGFSPVTNQTSSLIRRTSGRFTLFGRQPLWRSPEVGEGNPILEDSDFVVDESVDSEHTNQNYSNKEVSQKLENRSTENEETRGGDQSKLMTEGSHGHSGVTLAQVNCPVTYQTTPLTRKVSGKFTPFGLQPLYCSPEKVEDDQTSKDTDSTVDELVNSGHSYQNYYYKEVPQQPENRFTENEVKSTDDVNETCCSDVPNGFQEAPTEIIVACPDDKIDKNSDSEMSCGEETRRSFKTDPFANVVKKTGDNSRCEKAPVELIQEEVISSSASLAKCSLADENGYKNERPLKSVGSYSQKDVTCDPFKDSKQVTSSSVPSPERRAGSETLEVTASTADALEVDEDSKRKRTNLEDSFFRNNERDVCVQLEENLTANELKSCYDVNNTSCNDIPEELEEILLVSWISTHAEEESVYNTDVQVICEEEDSCISNVDALSTTCREDISMGANKTKMERRQENVVSGRSGKVYNVDEMIDDTDAAVISEKFRFENRNSLSDKQSERGRLEIENTSSLGNYEKETQQLENELAEKEDKSCNNAEDTVFNDRPKWIEMAHTQTCGERKATLDNSSPVKKDDKDTKGLKSSFQSSEKQKINESKENPWRETEVLVKSSVASFDDKERNLSSIDQKDDSILQNKTKACNFDRLNNKKGKKVSVGKAKFFSDNENSIVEEFIDEFDRFLDEVEREILTEETMSHISHSAESENNEKNVHERSVAAVVNISEYLFQKELFKALETAIPDNRKEYTSQSEEKSLEEELEEKRKYIAEDTHRFEDVVEYRYAIGIALKELNRINSLLVEAGEQLLGRRGTYGRFAVQGDTESGTAGLLNNISLLSDTAGDVMKDFKHVIQRTEQEPKLHKEKVEMKFAQLKRENNDLEMQISVIKEKLETYQKKIATLQADLDDSQVEVKQLVLKEEYKERELVNLKRDFQNKEEKWEEGNGTVEKVMADIKELWDDVDYLEESLKNSRESNEDLKFQVDELKITIKEMKKEYRMEHSRGGCGHLREEVELLNGSLKLKEQRVVLLESQEARQFAQLAVKDKELSDLNEENLKIVIKLKDQVAKLSRENSTLTAELLKMSGKNDPVGEMKEETLSIIKQLRKEKVKLNEEKNTLMSEMSQAYAEIESLKKVNHQVSNVMRQFEDELVRLKKEHFMTDVPAVSDNDNRWNEVKDEMLSVVRQLENKVSRLLKENSTLIEELSKESENKRQLHETSKTMNNLEDEIAKLQREKSTLSTELSANEFEKYYQLYELRCEKSRITRKFEDEITKLRRENSTLTARLSKQSKIKDKFTELREQVVVLNCNNTVLKEELAKAKNRSANDLESVLNDNCELAQDEERLSGSQNRKSPQIKVLKKRVHRSEKELSISRKFHRQRGLDFEERLPSDFEGDVISVGDEEVNGKDTLDPNREVTLDEGQKYKVQEMEETIRDLRQTLQQTESDLEHASSALRLKTERTDILERYMGEKEEILTMTSQRQKQREQDIDQTKGTLRWQKEGPEELKNQLKNLTEAGGTSMKCKEKEVQEAYCCLKEQDETIKNLPEEITQERCGKDCLEVQFENLGNLETHIQRMEDINRNTFHPVDSLVRELRQERSEKERLKRAMEAKERSSHEEKELKKTLEQLENQLREKDKLTNATLTSLKNNKRSLQEANDANNMLTELLKREKSEKENLRRALEASEYNTDEINRLTRKIGKLEKQLQEMGDQREKTLRSIQEKEWSLEEAHDKIKRLILEIAREKSDKEYFKTKFEAREGTAKEEKEQLAKTEKKLRTMNERQDRAQACLKAKEQKLDKMHHGIERKVNKVKELTKELQRERSEKQSLRNAVEKAESKAQQQRELLDEKDNEADKLKELVFDYKEKIENLNTNLTKLRKEVEIAGELLAYRNFDDRSLLFTMGIEHNCLKLIKTETNRNTQQQSLLMAQMGKRLSNLVQRQREAYASSLVMKKKEAHIKRVLEKLREDLNEKEEFMEDLKSRFQDSANECSSIRRQLEHIQCENVNLKQRLGDKDEKVRMLEITIKQLEEDLQKTQKCLRERETYLVDADETLQLKCSLLTTMEAKLSLRNKEIDELTEANKEKGLEMTRIETTLREVKKELDIAASIIEKQNKQCANLKTCAMRKTRDAEGIQDKLKRLTTQLECSRNEKSNLHRAVLAARSRLENERFFVERKQNALQVEVNMGLKEFNARSKQYWDVKMDLREAAARISILEDEKVEQEENLASFKGKVSGELDLLKETQHADNEKLSSLQLTIGSAGREMAKLTKENQRQFRIELLHNGLEKNSSKSSCEESTSSTLETRRGKAAYETTFLEDKNNVAASSQGDIKSKWANTPSFEKRFETRRDRHFNRASTIAALGSTNTVSILLCDG